MSNSPKFEDNLYNARKDGLALMGAFKGGRKTVAPLLTKWERESNEGYIARQKTATLFNQTKKTIFTANGMIFRKDISLSDDMNKAFLAKANDIDDADTSLNDFAKDIGETGQTDGLSLILIDAPKYDGDVITLQQQKALGLIPYFIKYEYSQVKNRRVENGKLVQITLEERVTDYTGEFGEESVVQERVLYIGGGKIYRKEKVIHEWTNNLPYIPIVPFYSNKTGFFDATPKYLDLAELNLKHFNFQSQLDKTLFIASNPIPLMYGNFDKESDVNVGVDKALVFDRKEEGGFEWVEFKGTSVDKLQEEIKNIEARMLAIGISILTDKQQTAKEATITSVGETSDLASVASSLERALNIAYSYWCDMMGVVTTGEITVNKDFTGATLSPAEAKIYLDMYQAGTITLNQFWDEMEMREYIKEFDREVVTAELEAKSQDVNLLG